MSSQEPAVAFNRRGRQREHPALALIRRLLARSTAADPVTGQPAIFAPGATPGRRGHLLHRVLQALGLRAPGARVQPIGRPADAEKKDNRLHSHQVANVSLDDALYDERASRVADDLSAELRCDVPLPEARAEMERLRGDIPGLVCASYERGFLTFYGPAALTIAAALGYGDQVDQREGLIRFGYYAPNGAGGCPELARIGIYPVVMPVAKARELTRDPRADVPQPSDVEAPPRQLPPKVHHMEAPSI